MAGTNGGGVTGIGPNMQEQTAGFPFEDKGKVKEGGRGVLKEPMGSTNGARRNPTARPAVPSPINGGGITGIGTNMQGQTAGFPFEDKGKAKEGVRDVLNEPTGSTSGAKRNTKERLVVPSPISSDEEATVGMSTRRDAGYKKIRQSQRRRIMELPVSSDEAEPKETCRPDIKTKPRKSSPEEAMLSTDEMVGRLDPLAEPKETKIPATVRHQMTTMFGLTCKRKTRIAVNWELEKRSPEGNMVKVTLPTYGCQPLEINSNCLNRNLFFVKWI